MKNRILAILALVVVGLLSSTVFAMQIIPAPPAAIGDTDMDGDFDADDLVIILQGAAGLPGDINGDGVVDVTDGVAMLDTIWDGGAGNVGDFGDFSYPWCEDINFCLDACSDSDIGTIVTGTDTIGDIVGCPIEPEPPVINPIDLSFLWTDNNADHFAFEFDLWSSDVDPTDWAKVGIHAREGGGGWFYDLEPIEVNPDFDASLISPYDGGQLECSAAVPFEDGLLSSCKLTANKNTIAAALASQSGSLDEGDLVSVDISVELTDATIVTVTSDPLYVINNGNGNSPVYTTFEVPPGTTCTGDPDLNGDGSVNIDDLNEFLSSTPDYNGDGEYNLQDFEDFYKDWQACK